jgi:hypothetical protein
MNATLTTTTHFAIRHQVHAAVLRRYQEWYGPEHMQRGSCLYWTLTGLGILTSLGFRALLQAGSMSWPILPPDQDDGHQPTHFSYEWSPWRPESQAALKLGLLPEIHIWIGLPDENELVDFSTKWFPQQAAKDGLVWRTEPPPDFLWCGPSDLPAGVIYRPDMEAIQFALRFIQTHHH